MSRANLPAAMIPGGGCIETGLTIREHFAAMAMQALIPIGNAHGAVFTDAYGKQRRQTLHEMAVEHADRQIAELAKPVRP